MGKNEEKKVKRIFIQDRISKKNELILNLRQLKKSNEQLIRMSGILLYAGHENAMSSIDAFLDGNMDLQTMYNRIQEAKQHSLMENPKFKKELFKLIEKYSEGVIK